MGRETIHGEDGPVLPYGGVNPTNPFVDVEEYSVGQWYPSPDGSGKPGAVQFNLDGIFVMPGGGPRAKAQMFLRLKSAEAVDELIRALLLSRRRVWPNEPVNIY